MDEPLDDEMPNHDTPNRSGPGLETPTLHNVVRCAFKSGQRIDGFEIGKLLGRGGSGTVHRVTSLATGKTMALKILHQGNQLAELRNRSGFRRMVRLRHRNLLRLRQIVSVGSFVGLAMDEVEGETFRSWLKRSKDLGGEELQTRLLNLMRDYATGLAVIHHHGYMHCDINPQNLMVDRDGRGIIVDYGLVVEFKFEDGLISAESGLRGTPPFLAPEAIFRQRHLPASDIYALGLVFCDALRITILREAKFDNWYDKTATNRTGDRTIDLTTVNMMLDLLQESSAADSDLRTLLEACRDMVSRYSSDRPTAADLSRRGIVDAPVVSPEREESLIDVDRSVEQSVRTLIREVLQGRVAWLHLHGASGVGKTALLRRIHQMIESFAYADVFKAACLQPNTRSLSGLETVMDDIVAAYRRPDHSPLMMPVEASSTLRTKFRVFQTIFPEADGEDHSKPSHDVVDYIEAVGQLSHEMRRQSPYFILIDDCGNLDDDSLRMLRYLRAANVSQINGELNGMAIITSSTMDVGDDPHLPFDISIEAKPIDLERSLELLQEWTSHAQQDIEASVRQRMLRKLSKLSEGNLTRLREWAYEINEGHVDLAQLDESGALKTLWRTRLDRLSAPARDVFELIAAGGLVSSTDLERLTGLGSQVDIAISELVVARLVHDTGSETDAVSVLTDQVTAEVVASIAPAPFQTAHRSWAELLINRKDQEQQPERIAKHLIAAGEGSRAVHFAVLAARQYDEDGNLSQVAYWNQAASEHSERSDAVNYLNVAAAAYTRSGAPLKAAECFAKISQLTKGSESSGAAMQSIMSSIRGGHLEEVKPELDRLCKLLGVPRRKPQWLSKIKCVYYALRSKPIELAADPSDDHPHSSAEQERQHRRIEVCQKLARPMSMYDNWHSLELNLWAAANIHQHGTLTQRLVVALGEGVFQTYHTGKTREKGLERLRQLQGRFVDNQPHLYGHCSSALAVGEMLSCEFANAMKNAKTAIETYKDADDCKFECSHTLWSLAFAQWHCGDWKAAVTAIRQGQLEAVSNNDAYMSRLFQNDYSRCFRLAIADSDETVQSLTAKVQQLENELKSESAQFIQLFQWKGLFHEAMWIRAGDLCDRIAKSWQYSLKHSAVCRSSMMTILYHAAVTLHELHQIADVPSHDRMTKVQRGIAVLRRYDEPFAVTVSSLYAGWAKLADAETASTVKHRNESIDVARSLFAKSLVVAGEQGLLPLELASRDALQRLDRVDPQLCGGRILRSLGSLSESKARAAVIESSSLCRSLADAEISSPLRVAALYTLI